jgi:hypothetical protein
MTTLIVATRTVASMLKDIEFKGGNEAYETFRRCPIPEVRKACLRVMSHHSWMTNAGEVEQDLSSLPADDLVWEEFLHEYARSMWSRGADRAIPFVIKVCPKKPLRSRVVRNFLLYHKEHYPLVRGFLREEVQAFLDTISKQNWYDQDDWYCLSRALTVLTEYADYPCLTHLRLIARRLGESKMRPAFSGTGPGDQRFLLVQHRAYVHEAVRQLAHAEAAAREAEQLSAEEGVEVRPVTNP